MVDGARFFERLEVFPLQVLDQLFGQALIGGHDLFDNAGDRVEVRHICSPPAALASDDLILIDMLQPGDCDGVEHTVLPDAVGQSLQALLTVVLAGLVRIFDDLTDLYLLDFHCWDASVTLG